MQITGKITAVSRLGAPVGNYDNCYQDITILGVSGRTKTGNIGSKKGYAIGSEITVEVTEDPQYGTKFKRIDPNYNKQQYDQSTASGGRDYDKEGHGKCFSIILCAFIQGGALPRVVAEDHETLMAIAALATACINSYDYRAKPQSADDRDYGQPNPDYVGENPSPPPEDNIPF